MEVIGSRLTVMQSIAYVNVKHESHGVTLSVSLINAELWYHFEVAITPAVWFLVSMNHRNETFVTVSTCCSFITILSRAMQSTTCQQLHSQVVTVKQANIKADSSQ